MVREIVEKNKKRCEVTEANLNEFLEFVQNQKEQGKFDYTKMQEHINQLCWGIECSDSILDLLHKNYKKNGKV